MAYSKKQEKIKRPSTDKKVEGQINVIKQVGDPRIDPLSYERMYPAWSFKRMQQETMWIFPPEDLISHHENCIHSQCVLAKLASFEKMTWSEIKRQQHGHRGKSSSHFIEDLSKLNRNAQKRLRELQISENLFSLRLEGKVRIFGILQSHIFEVLWYDAGHEIYPVD